jgi:hypothetical protein
MACRIIPTFVIFITEGSCGMCFILVFAIGDGLDCDRYNYTLTSYKFMLQFDYKISDTNFQSARLISICVRD